MAQLLSKKVTHRKQPLCTAWRQPEKLEFQSRCLNQIGEMLDNGMRISPDMTYRGDSWQGWERVLAVELRNPEVRCAAGQAQA